MLEHDRIPKNRKCVCDHVYVKHNLDTGICKVRDCDCDEFFAVSDHRDNMSDAEAADHAIYQT